jgi:hypothetical protein
MYFYFGKEKRFSFANKYYICDIDIRNNELHSIIDESAETESERWRAGGGMKEARERERERERQRQTNIKKGTRKPVVLLTLILSPATVAAL